MYFKATYQILGCLNNIKTADLQMLKNIEWKNNIINGKSWSRYV